MKERSGEIPPEQGSAEQKGKEKQKRLTEE